MQHSDVAVNAVTSGILGWISASLFGERFHLKAERHFQICVSPELVSSLHNSGFSEPVFVGSKKSSQATLWRSAATMWTVL